MGDVGDQFFLGGERLHEAGHIAVDDDGAAEPAVVVPYDPGRRGNGAPGAALAEPHQVVRKSFPRNGPADRSLVLRQRRDLVLAEHELPGFLHFRGCACGRRSLQERLLLIVDEHFMAVGVDGDDADVDGVQDGFEKPFTRPALNEQFAEFGVLSFEPLSLHTDIGAREPDCQRDGQHHERQEDCSGNVRR